MQLETSVTHLLPPLFEFFPHFTSSVVHITFRLRVRGQSLSQLSRIKNETKRSNYFSTNLLLVENFV